MSGSDNHWDRRYDQEAYVFGTEPNVFLVQQAHRLSAGQTALAVADGEGRNGVWLAERGLKVISVDSSAVAQAKAQKLALTRGAVLETQLADLALWEWPKGGFDLVVGIFIQFADPVLRSRIFAAMADALNPGGLILLQGYRPEQIAYGTGGPKLVENLYSGAMLRSAFAELEILDLAVHDSVIREGDGHDGMSALIDLVARKPVQATGHDVR